MPTTHMERCKRYRDKNREDYRINEKTEQKTEVLGKLINDMTSRKKNRLLVNLRWKPVTLDSK